MSTPFIAELKITSFNFAPKGWALCNGQLLPINTNQALFSLLGTTYGGDGRVNFALPNLQGRIPMHMGAGFTLGQRGGEENHTLSASEMPAHSHIANADAATGSNTTDNPGGSYPANTGGTPMYSPGSSNMIAMFPTMVSTVGGSQPHSNQSPFTVLSVCIALQGIFPTRS